MADILEGPWRPKVKLELEEIDAQALEQCLTQAIAALEVRAERENAVWLSKDCLERVRRTLRTALGWQTDGV